MRARWFAVMRRPSAPPAAPTVSGKREPKRSESLPTCQESSSGNAEEVPARMPTAKGSAPSFSA